jgi:membrane fusion protein (multidrug efflux system)
LFSVVGDSGVWITANLKETQLETVRVGQTVDIEVDACPGTPVNGLVESIAPATGARFALLPPDNATGNFTKVVQRVPVRIRPTAMPKDCALRPGMSVTVHIETK